MLTIPNFSSNSEKKKKRKERDSLRGSVAYDQVLKNDETFAVIHANSMRNRTQL